MAAERLFADPACRDPCSSVRGYGRPDRASPVAAEIASEAIGQFGDGGNDLGYRMIAAGLLLTTGAVDHDRLGQAVHEKH